MKRRPSSAAGSAPPAGGALAPDGEAAGALADPGRDRLLSLRDRIAADGPEQRRWTLPRLGSPAVWLLDEPLLFGAVLVAVLLLGLALGARLFHSGDERRLIVPTVVVQTNPPVQPTPAAVRTAPPELPAAADAPTAAVTHPIAPPLSNAAAATTRPTATSTAQATVPPPAAGSALTNIVNGAARQSAPAGVPPPAAGFPAGSSGRAAAAGGAAAAGSAAPAQPPDLDAALQSVAAQGQRAATAAAGHGPAVAPAAVRTVPAQPTTRH